MQCRLEPLEWEARYPVHIEPIGRIRRRGGRFEAELAHEHLGPFTTGDVAVEAVREQYLERCRVRHEAASRTHGGYERHRVDGFA